MIIFKCTFTLNEMAFSLTIKRNLLQLNYAEGNLSQWRKGMDLVRQAFGQGGKDYQLSIFGPYVAVYIFPKGITDKRLANFFSQVVEHETILTLYHQYLEEYQQKHGVALESHPKVIKYGTSLEEFARQQEMERAAQKPPELDVSKLTKRHHHSPLHWLRTHGFWRRKSEDCKTEHKSQIMTQSSAPPVC